MANHRKDSWLNRASCLVGITSFTHGILRVGAV